MKEEDYQNYEQNVLNAIIQFQHLFSDYIKQIDPELWQRAVDYAKDYSSSGNVSFNYASEKTPDSVLSSTLSQTIFVKELADDLEQTREEYMDFVEEHSKLPTSEIQKKWLEETGYTSDDPFGYERNLDLFMKCNHKFTFSEFDEEDWLNYTNIVVSCIKDKEFQQNYMGIIAAMVEYSDIYQYFIRCMEEQDNV